MFCARFSFGKRNIQLKMKLLCIYIYVCVFGCGCVGAGIMYKRVGLIDQDMHATANKAQFSCILVAAAAAAAIWQRFPL